jgi:membrane associated rhomboid family serine protease
MLTVVIAVALFVQARRPKMPVYGATVVWAAIGVVLANWADTPIVAYTAALGAVIVALWTLITLRRA